MPPMATVMAATTVSTPRRNPVSPYVEGLSGSRSFSDSPLGSARQQQYPPSPSGGVDGEKPYASFEEIERDPIFSKFLEPNFNAAQFASQVLSTGSALSSSTKLTDGIQLLDRQLRSEVVLRHDELRQQLSSLRDTEAVLAVVRAGVDSLQTSVQRVRAEIAEPYKQVKQKTRQLASLHETTGLLRAVIKVLKQVKRLREHLASGIAKAELAKAAQLYSEIDSLRSEVDMAGVEVIDAELPWLADVGQELRSEAMKNLEQGMETLNQAEVGAVLQVYFNLGELRSTVDLLLSRYKQQANRAIVSALDMKAVTSSAASSSLLAAPGPGGVSRSGTPALGGAPKAREALWQRIQQCVDTLHSLLIASWHLQRVLAKKRDPISHVIFLDQVLQGGGDPLPLPTERLWEGVVRSLTSHFRASFTGSSFIKETFVGAYPRLLLLLRTLTDRLAKDTDVKGAAPAVKPSDRDNLVAALEPFQSAYLAQSLTRLNDLVNSVLPSGHRGAIPGADQVSRIVARVEEEIQAVKSDEALTLLVLKGVGKALQLLGERAEYQVSLSPDVRQVSGPATASQQRNAALCIFLQELHTDLLPLLSSFPASAHSALHGGLAAILSVASSAVTPLFTAMVDRVESCLLLIHTQDFQSNDLVDSPSPHLDETVRAMAHFRSEFLARLLPSPTSSLPHLPSPESEEPICLGLVRRMASRILLFFVRHAALVRPLSEPGKLRLARDMSELEFATGQYLCSPEQLGLPYRALRAFRPFLFLETSQLAGSQLLQDIPPSAVIHHLFSRAPEDLESPMKQNGLSPSQYSLWLDRHSEEETWKEVKACLDSYARKVQERGDKEFSPIYPTILHLGQTLVESGREFGHVGVGGR